MIGLWEVYPRGQVQLQSLSTNFKEKGKEKSKSKCLLILMWKGKKVWWYLDTYLRLIKKKTLDMIIDLSLHNNYVSCKFYFYYSNVYEIKNSYIWHRIS